jgi:sugar phosphate isomerase/epimerase
MSTRRQFLRTAVAAGLSAPLLAGRAAAIDPIRRTGQAPIRLSVAAYSFRQELDLKRKPTPALDLDGFIDRCAGYGVDAVELTQYYFPDTAPEYLARLKGHCTRLGLDVSGTAVGNDFCVRDPARLAAQVESVKRWAEYTARLGGKTMRIFAGKAEKGDSEDDARARCVAAIQEACDHAAKVGVYLALENHGGIVSTAEQMLAIIKAVRHDWFGVNLDTGNFQTPDPYGDLAKIAPYAVTVQIKSEVAPSGRKQDADFPRLIAILRDANYRGYVALEYEAKEEAGTAVPRHLQALRRALGGS